MKTQPPKAVSRLRRSCWLEVGGSPGPARIPSGRGMLASRARSLVVLAGPGQKRSEGDVVVEAGRGTCGRRGVDAGEVLDEVVVARDELVQAAGGGQQRHCEQEERLVAVRRFAGDIEHG